MPAWRLSCCRMAHQYKTLESLNLIFTALLSENHGRDTTIIALGGGVIGDIAIMPPQVINVACVLSKFLRRFSASRSSVMAKPRLIMN